MIIKKQLAKEMNNLQLILAHQQQLSRCQSCPDMIQPVIIGHAVMSEIILVGQAPGGKEGDLGRPFAWTAGKTLFRVSSESHTPQSPVV